MATMTKSWTDERLEERFDRIDVEIGDLRDQMDLRFKEVDRRFEQIDKRFEQIDRRFEQGDRRFEQGFGQVDRRFEQIAASLDQINARFDGMQRTLMQLGGVTIAALLGILATQL